MYLITTFKILVIEYRPIYWNFFTPSFWYQHRPQKSHISQALVSISCLCANLDPSGDYLASLALSKIKGEGHHL